MKYLNNILTTKENMQMNLYYQTWHFVVVIDRYLRNCIYI